MENTSVETDFEIDRKKIMETLERVRYSLNCRFEKDANLFVSSQQIQEIKGMIKDGKWQGIFGMFQTNHLSSEILTIAIIKNSWLANENISVNDIKQYIIPILDMCEVDIYTDIAERVINNRIYMPYQIKQSIQIIYYKKVDIELCRKILDGKDILTDNIEVLKQCFYRVLDTCKKAHEMYYAIDGYVKMYSQLSANYKIVSSYIRRLDRNEAWKKEFTDYIFEKKIENNENPDIVWINIFRALGKYAVDKCLDYLRYELEDEDKMARQIIKLYIVHGIDKDEESREYYIEQWQEIFLEESDFCLRKEFIFAVRRIKNEEAKAQLIDMMLDVDDLPRMLISKLTEIKEEEEQKEKISDSEELLEKVVEGYGSKEEKHLKYLVYVLRESENKDELLKGLMESLNIEEIQDFFILILNINFDKFYNQLVCKYIVEFIESGAENRAKENMYAKFKKVLEGKRPNFVEVKQLLQKRDFELYKKLYGKIN